MDERANVRDIVFVFPKASQRPLEESGLAAGKGTHGEFVILIRRACHSLIKFSNHIKEAALHCKAGWPEKAFDGHKLGDECWPAAKKRSADVRKIGPEFRHVGKPVCERQAPWSKGPMIYVHHIKLAIVGD